MTQWVIKDYFNRLRWGSIKKSFQLGSGWIFFYFMIIIPLISGYYESRNVMLSYLLVMGPLQFCMFSSTLHSMALPKIMYLCPMDMESRRKYLMASYMMQAFSSIYGENVTPLPLSQTDLDAIQKLRTIYAGEEWLYKKPIPFTCTMEGHFSFGHLQLQLFVQEGTVQTVNTFTDAMDAALPEKLEAALLGCPFQTGALASAVSTLEIGSELSPFIQNQQL